MRPVDLLRAVKFLKLQDSAPAEQAIVNIASVSGIRWLLRGDQSRSHSVHPDDRSPIRSVGHTRELDPPWDDEHADGLRPRDHRRYGGTTEEMLRRRDEQCPMERMGDTLFLASDEAKYITGTELAVDGGLTVNCV